ncbi:MAG: hypothetical protein R3357_13810 [Burkholderiales bacterium]|nr:hypothetical protein [Burkholderiales bacterium]
MNLARRAALALPDAAAAAIFLWCWIAPTAWRPQLVGLLVLAFLIEFVVVQAGPFIGTVVYADKMGLDRRRRMRTATALGVTYLVFAGLAAASFDAWFPLLIFVWLFGVKVFTAVCGRDRAATGREREMTVWILSVSYYFLAVFLTMFVPVPMLGITEDGAVYGLRGQYEWANFPYEAIAAGFFYFFALALTRLLLRRTAMDLSGSDGSGAAPGEAAR